MIEITKEDAQNILVMSEKVQISGKEAMAVAQLQLKLSQGLEALDAKKPEVVEAVPDKKKK